MKSHPEQKSNESFYGNGFTHNIHKYGNRPGYRIGKVAYKSNGAKAGHQFKPVFITKALMAINN